MSKNAWIAVVVGYALMAAGFIVFAFLLAEAVRDNQQAKDALRIQGRQAATVAVHNAGAICLGLSAPTKEKEMAILDSFLRGDGTIVAQFTPLCARVAERAARDIFNNQIPAELQAELNAVK